MLDVSVLIEKAREIREAIRQAGREIVESMIVSPETMERIEPGFHRRPGSLFYDRQPFLEELHCGKGKPPGVW